MVLLGFPLLIIWLKLYICLLVLLLHHIEILTNTLAGSKKLTNIRPIFLEGSWHVWLRDYWIYWPQFFLFSLLLFGNLDALPVLLCPLWTCILGWCCHNSKLAVLEVLPEDVREPQWHVTSYEQQRSDTFVLSLYLRVPSRPHPIALRTSPAPWL